MRVDYAKGVTIYGSGVLQNCSGDGLDIDVSQDIFVSGISAQNNSGAGFHMGSGRPIESSENILGIGLTSKSNGHKLGRAGLDVSWPNENSNVYILSIGEENYRNWELEGAGVLSFLTLSGDFDEPDELSGASFSMVNGASRSSYIENLIYVKYLIRRDILRAYGKVADFFIDPKNIEVDYKGNRVGRSPDYLLPLTYSRSE